MATKRSHEEEDHGYKKQRASAEASLDVKADQQSQSQPPSGTEKAFWEDSFVADCNLNVVQPFSFEKKNILQDGDNLIISFEQSDTNNNKWATELAKTLVKNGNEKCNMRTPFKIDEILQNTESINDSSKSSSINVNLLQNETDSHTECPVVAHEADLPHAAIQLSAPPLELKEPPITISDLQDLLDSNFDENQLKEGGNEPEIEFERIVKFIPKDDVPVAKETPLNPAENTNSTLPNKTKVKITALSDRPAPAKSKEFISTDQVENLDNFSTGWAPLQNATSDEELYRLIRQRWRNLAVPNPRKNYSHYAVRLQKYPAWPLPTQPRPSGHRRTKSCTTSLETMLNKAKQARSQEESNLIFKQRNERNDLSTQQLMHYTAVKNTLGFSAFNYQLVDQIDYQHSKEVEDLKRRHLDQLRSLQNKMNCDIRKLTEYIKEAKSLFSFYTGVDDNNEDMTLLTEEQMEFLEEKDAMFDKFNRFY